MTTAATSDLGAVGKPERNTHLGHDRKVPFVLVTVQVDTICKLDVLRHLLLAVAEK